MMFTFPSFNGRSAEAVKTAWQALLVGFIYRDQAPRSGLAPLAGTGDGLGGGVMPGGPRPNRQYRTLSASGLTCLAEQNASKLGARITAIHLLHLEGLPIPEVTVQIPSALANRSGGETGLSGALFHYNKPPYSPYVAYLVQAQDEQGRWIQSFGSAPPSGQGTGTSDSKYDHAQTCGGLIACTAHG